MSLDYLDLAILPPKEDDDLKSAISDNNEHRCRICLEDINISDEKDNIISPCACSGTMGLVHISCFDKQGISHCPVCKFKVRFFDNNRLEQLKSLERQIRDILNPIAETANDEYGEQDDFQPHPHIHMFNLPPMHGDLLDPQGHEDILQQIRILPRGDGFAQIEQIMPLIPENIPSIFGVELPFRQMVITSIADARKIIIDRETARIYYFAYSFLTNLSQYKNTTKFFAKLILANFLFGLMLSLILVKSLFASTYVGLKVIVGRG